MIAIEAIMMADSQVVRGRSISGDPLSSLVFARLPTRGAASSFDDRPKLPSRRKIWRTSTQVRPPSVKIGYLSGDASAGQLFSADESGRIRLAINAIVLRDHLRVLPLDAAKAEALISRVRAMRNRIVHSNDVLILSSADECDFFVTRDRRIKELVTSDKPQVVTAEELAHRLRAA